MSLSIHEKNIVQENATVDASEMCSQALDDAIQSVVRDTIFVLLGMGIWLCIGGALSGLCIPNEEIGKRTAGRSWKTICSTPSYEDFALKGVELGVVVAAKTHCFSRTAESKKDSGEGSSLPFKQLALGVVKGALSALATVVTIELLKRA